MNNVNNELDESWHTSTKSILRKRGLRGRMMEISHFAFPLRSKGCDRNDRQWFLWEAVLKEMFLATKTQRHQEIPNIFCCILNT